MSTKKTMVVRYPERTCARKDGLLPWAFKLKSKRRSTALYSAQATLSMVVCVWGECVWRVCNVSLSVSSRLSMMKEYPSQTLPQHPAILLSMAHHHPTYKTPGRTHRRPVDSKSAASISLAIRSGKPSTLLTKVATCRSRITVPTKGERKASGPMIGYGVDLSCIASITSVSPRHALPLSIIMPGRPKKCEDVRTLHPGPLPAPANSPQLRGARPNAAHDPNEHLVGEGGGQVVGIAAAGCGVGMRMGWGVRLVR